ncbi:MAG: Ig-like domain-containing protein, partial [Eubacteriales bacterium]|nr:Ig-like domain-containing protein [Eubacteriales bacterium]
MKNIRKLNVMIVIMMSLIGALAVPDTIKAAEKKAVELNKKSLTLTVGKTSKLTLKNTPKNKNITWDSSKKKIATVTKKGNVRAIKRGKATITAKMGNQKYTCKVTVIKKNASDVAALKQLIKKQQKAGATVPKDINASCYTWNDKGRLSGIAWNQKKLKGT